MPLLLITALATAAALAGCAGGGLRTSFSTGGSAERPAWRHEVPAAPEPAARHPAPEGLDRA